MASGLQGALDELTQRYAAAQASQAEREAELKGLMPRLESYERLGTDLQVFTQSRQRALSLAGQPDRGVDDYRQTIEVSTGLRSGYQKVRQNVSPTLCPVLLFSGGPV